VDLHCHVAGLGARGSGCFVSEDLHDDVRFGAFLDAFGVTEEELREQGDALLVEHVARLVGESLVSRVVVLALDGVVGPDGELDRAATECYVPGEWLVAEVARHENLLFGASINPYRRDALERLETAARQGAVLVKWIPPIQAIDPADPALEPFYSRMRSLRLPLLTHTGSERSFTRSRDELGDPERLRLPLRCGVTVIAAHAAAAGGGTLFASLCALAEEFPRLFVDLSALTQLNRPGGLERLLVTPALEGRILYGTDYPLIATRLVSPWYHPLRLTVAQMRELSGVTNPFDRDVLLKQALGVPADVFAATGRLLSEAP
jgi:predicted TIM-barrel fold metal-dependent hydrolase